MGRPYKKPQITCPYPASSGQIPESWSAADGFLQRSPTRICGLCSNQSTFIACFNAGETQGNLAAVFGLGRALYKISPRLLQLFFFFIWESLLEVLLCQGPEGAPLSIYKGKGRYRAQENLGDGALLHYANCLP